MYIKKLTAILIAILIAAVGFQVLRSFTMINLIKNVNYQTVLPEPKSAAVPAGLKFEKYLIVSDKNEQNSLQTEEQLKKVLDYMKKSYQVINAGDKLSVISDFDCIFLTFERLDYLKNLQDYLDYVNSGGNLVFLTRPVVDKSFEKISSLLGIKSYFTNMVNTAGVKMLSDIIIGAKGFETNNDIVKNSSIDIKLDDNVNPYMTSYGDIPLLWKKNYGKGHFVIFNGTILNGKGARGLMAGVISLGKENLIYPIINVKMIHIDDFPAPIQQGRDAKIFEEFDRDIPQFYREVWWSDMVKISKKYDLAYTGFVIETYNNDTTGPFKNPEAKNLQNLLIYGKELLRIGGEIGLHGYNHQSLAPEGYIKQDLNYNPWNNENDMVSSIKELIRYIHTVFGNYALEAYVPPSNILSAEGRKAVIEANPELKVISSVYPVSLLGDAYAQEFSIAEDGIIEFPRISAGYEKTDVNMWRIYNGINLYGVFAHFVHPDDVLDPARNNGKSWTELSKEFDLMIGEVTSKYGWLRKFTISPAGQELIKYNDCVPNIEYSQNSINIYVKNYREDIYCILRTDRKIINTQNCGCNKIGEDAYLLTLKDDICKLDLEVK